MAYVTSSSTIAQIRAAIQDGADYDVSNSVTKCKEFIVACRALLAIIAAAVSSGEHSVTESPERIEALMKAAEMWLAANDSTFNSASKGFVTHGSFEYFRS
jgi:hypothetical protein